MRLQQVRACASAPQGGPGGRQRAVLPAVPCADHRSQPAGCGMLRDLPARFSWPPPPTRALGGGRRGRGRWLGGGPLTVGEKDENAALLCSGTWKLWYSSGPYCGQSRGQPDQPPALRADADSTRGAETKIKPRGHRELCGSRSSAAHGAPALVGADGEHNAPFLLGCSSRRALIPGSTPTFPGEPGELARGFHSCRVPP